ncbi:hypothetical protein ABL78_4219 [Leptomonas seymouri]|uniref:Treble clef zinc finger domain-containing protein n=1 Tax=Leptomonas seymouri TaxID=5684 RepID=A0A0N1HYJ6_LEPSE|nr:hypothetical protein ABL78_4219 [Leptomonas seymouri]|eukprot:KPI86703.1 hypothetical protein ABL78_4219 [Leptomonas seymouri]
MRRVRSCSSASLTVRALWQRNAAVVAPSAALSTRGVLRCYFSTDAAPQSTSDAAPANSAAAVASRPQRQLRLAVVRPDLLDDWIPELNDLDAQRVSCSDAVTSVWWRCPCCGRQYQSTVQSRVARGRATCPHCSGFGSAAASSTSASEAAPGNEEPLAVTHPEVAARWDVKRNGGVLPSQVTASSTRRVWWRPAPHSKSSRSFQRPVFAFVQNSASPDEQAAAVAAMEWKLLSAIREAARVQEAEQLGSMPVTLSAEAMATGALHDHAVWSDAAEPESQTREALSSNGYAAAGTAPLSPENAATVALLWKARARKLIAAAKTQAGTQRHSDLKNYTAASPPSEERGTERGADKAAASAVPISPRELFAYSFARAPPRRFGATVVSTSYYSAGTASIVRETLLNQYHDFVYQQRTKDALAPGKEQMPLPPPVLNLGPEVAAGSCGTTWLDFFHLTKEEVQPKGFIDPSAALYFSSAVETAAGNTHASSYSAIPMVSFPAARAAVKPPAPDGVISPDAQLIFSYYPRRTSNPPPWEDDLTESVPPMPSVLTSFATDAEQALGDHGEANHRESAGGAAAVACLHHSSAFRIDAPFGVFGAAGSVATRSTAELAAEYEEADHLDADAGAALASELRDIEKHSTSGSVPASLDPSTTSTSSASLVNSAIAALGSALHASGGVDDVVVEFADISDRRYNRGVQPSLMRDGGRSQGSKASPVAREGGQQQHKFRLSMPQEGLSGQLSWRRLRHQESLAKGAHLTKEPADAAPEKQRQPALGESTPLSALQFDAPRSPRKVARPRRHRKDAAEAAEPAPSGEA